MLNPLQTFIITCLDKNEKPNIITLSYVFPVSSNTPRIMIGIRPENYSHGAINDTREFVVNVPAINLIKQTEDFVNYD